MAHTCPHCGSDLAKPEPVVGGKTRRQRDALVFIQGYIAENDYSPSFEEIMSAIGLRSKSGVHRIVYALHDRGLIQYAPGRKRGIALTDGQIA